MGKYEYRGRSWETSQFNYSMIYKAIMKLNYFFYPLVNLLFFTDKLYTFYYKQIGVAVGNGSLIRKGTFINDPRALEIGSFSTVHGEFKTRGGVRIGNYVELVQDVMVSTQSHNVHSSHFESVYKSVIINDFCWIGPRACILQGCELLEGTVIGAMSVVTKSNSVPWTLLVGIPAVEKGRRPKLIIP